MTDQPGLIILLGSGETSATIRKVYYRLFESLNTEIQLGILETPAGFEPNSDQVAGQIADFFKQRLQNFRPSVTVIPARKRGTPHSPDNPEILSPLLKANLIMMGPGSPTYTVRQLQDSIAWQTLTARHRLGATLIFASAATISVSAKALPVYEIYKVGEELHWKSGLNLFDPFGLSMIFIPHWNNTDGGADLDTSRCYIGQARYNQLVKLLPANSTIVGIDERTALVIDPLNATAQVMGQGGVTVARAGQEQFYSNEQRFDLNKLGPYQLLSDPKVGISDEVWDWVFTAHDVARQRDETPVPPDELLALLDKRNEARAQKDWRSADKLRDEIGSMGWQVIDTAEGTQLKPV